jgi:hypothetical protein
VGAIAHLFRLVSGRAGLETAALAIASMAAASTIGRLIGGLITLRLPVRAFALGLMAPGKSFKVDKKFLEAFGGAWTDERDMPAPTGKTFRELYKARNR